MDERFAGAQLDSGEAESPLIAALEAVLRQARRKPSSPSERARLASLVAELECEFAGAAPQRGEQAALLHGLGTATAELRALTDSSSILVWLADATRNAVYFNASWLRFTGRELESELRRGWLAGIHADDLEVFERQLDLAYADCQPFRAEIRLRSADGSDRWIGIEGNPLYGSKGEFLGFAGFCTDIHERKRIDVALDHLASHYAKLSGSAFYEAVCRHIAGALDLDFVFVGEVASSG